MFEGKIDIFSSVYDWHMSGFTGRLMSSPRDATEAVCVSITHILKMAIRASYKRNSIVLMVWRHASPREVSQYSPPIACPPNSEFEDDAQRSIKSLDASL